MRIDSLGLVPLLALRVRPSVRFEAIESGLAIVRTKSGARQVYIRGMPAMGYAVPWWTCPAIED